MLMLTNSSESEMYSPVISNLCCISSACHTTLRQGVCVAAAIRMWTACRCSLRRQTWPCNQILDSAAHPAQAGSALPALQRFLYPLIRLFAAASDRSRRLHYHWRHPRYLFVSTSESGRASAQHSLIRISIGRQERATSKPSCHTKRMCSRPAKQVQLSHTASVQQTRGR